MPVAIAMVLAAWLVPCARAVVETTSRPNILWVVTEDNSPSFVGGYGDPLARTPNFDRLAKDGIVFERAYAAAPVCAPSRASLITGMYAPSLGTQHMRSFVELPEWVRYFPAYLRDTGYFTTNHSKTDYNAAVLPGTWDQNGDNAHWRNRRPGQPFFSVFNFAASHESRLHTRRPLKTDPARVHVPSYLPDTAEVRADIAQYYNCVAEADRQIGEVLKQLEADGLAEDTIIFYYSDHGGVLPRSKRFLFESGTRVPLVVRFPKKFQSLAPGSSGSRNTELVSLIDLAPTVLSLAGLQPPEFMQGRAFAGIGAKAAPTYIYNFRDRMDERYDLSRSVVDTRFRYNRHYRPELPAGQHLDYLWKMASMATLDRLRNEGKLNKIQAAFFQPRSPEELFDVQADPDNIRNLAQDPAYREHLLRLRAANRAHLLATRDVGFVPEAMLRVETKTRTPAEFARDETVYPLERILEFIDRIQLVTTPATETVRDGLRHASPVMRYWATLGSPRSSIDSKLLLDALQDENIDVRVAAASALLTRGDSPEAWTTLAETLTGEHSNEARLAAANALANRPHWPESLRPALTAAAEADSSKEPGTGTLCRYLLRQAR